MDCWGRGLGPSYTARQEGNSASPCCHEVPPVYALLFAPIDGAEEGPVIGRFETASRSAQRIHTVPHTHTGSIPTAIWTRILVRARNGESGLPADLIARIHDGPFGPLHLHALANGLACIADEESTTDVHYSVLGAFVRNLVLFPLISGYGFRRLMPLQQTNHTGCY